MPDKKLAAIVIIGDSRERGQRALNSLYSQTIANSMEIIVFDLATRDVPRLVTSSQVPTTYVVPSQVVSWARARAQAVQLANAPIVAFIEDHCLAEAGWAKALVHAHQGPWACVGYAFTNPDPENYLSRATLISEYGMWMHPTQSRQTRLLPCGNAAYKRDLLLAWGEELETLLTPDFVAHERFKQQGLGLYVESGALVSHSSFAHLHELASASLVFCRLLAGNRAQTQAWSRMKRIVYGLGTPVVGPTIAIIRLLASLRGRRSLWVSFMMSLPIVFLKGVSSALGESLGYLFGIGSSEHAFDKMELYMERMEP